MEKILTVQIMNNEKVIVQQDILEFSIEKGKMYLTFLDGKKLDYDIEFIPNVRVVCK